MNSINLVHQLEEQAKKLENENWHEAASLMREAAVMLKEAEVLLREAYKHLGKLG